MVLIAITIALLTGLANPVQAGANAQLNKSLGAPVWAAVWVYSSGLAGMLLCALLAGRGAQLPHGSALRGAPWWAWAGGVASLAPTLAGLLYAQRLGAGLFTALSITASLVASMLLDQLGWLGFEHHPATAGRLVGCALLVGGVWLVARF